MLLDVRRCFASLLLLAGLASGASALPLQTVDVSREESLAYVRTRELAGASTALELAVRTFAPADGAEDGAEPKPRIVLASAIHVGEQAYYEKLQAILNEADLVLYEAVLPEGVESPAEALERSAEEPSEEEAVPDGDLDAESIREVRGIQQSIASALGLRFQLDAIDYSQAHWRNSDLSLEEVQRRLSGGDVEAEELFGALDGSSFLGMLAGRMLELLASTRVGSAALKIVGIEVLGRADELFRALPPELGTLFQVLLEDRNAKVLDDLRRVLEDEPAHETIAIFYGAAHMSGIEQGLREELGYVAEEVAWIPAVHVDLDDLGIGRAQARMLRNLVRQSLDLQLAMMEEMGDSER